MKKIYNCSLGEIQDYFIQNNYNSFDLSFYDILNFYTFNINNLNIKELANVNINEYSQSSPAKTVIIHFIKNQIRDFYIKFHIINNQIKTILKAFYKKYIIIENKKYLIESYYSFFSDQSYTFVWSDTAYFYKDDCFYNPEEIPKIINNLIFL